MEFFVNYFRKYYAKQMKSKMCDIKQIHNKIEKLCLLKFVFNISNVKGLVFMNIE